MPRNRRTRRAADAELGETVVTIERLAKGGDGVAKEESGRTIFVPFAAPGDRVRVRRTEVHKRFARGEIVSLLEPGADRALPRCEAFGRCGGCSWQHVAYPAQVEAKRHAIADALMRIGGFEVDPGFAFHASPEPYGYRSRARLLSRQGRVGYRARRSHAVCAVEACPVLEPRLSDELARLAAKGLPGRAGFPDPDGDEWELSAGDDGVRLVALPVERGGPDAPIHQRIGPDRLRFSPGVFSQANTLLVERLVERVAAAAFAPPHRSPRVLELHAGAGTLSLALACQAGALLAVEANPVAASDLRHNLAVAGLAERVEVRSQRSEDCLESDLPFSPDVVVLDPPRSGLEASSCAALVRLAPDRIVYLSCDPATQARDLGIVAERGWELTHVEGFDLFPQTAHVESLCVMELR